jgi:ketosteroid isomerase-like protein
LGNSQFETKAPADSLEKGRLAHGIAGPRGVCGTRITHELAEGERVALEVEWTGTLAVPFGALPAGSQMKAYFAMFLEFREGKIVEQRNYDCSEKW